MCCIASKSLSRLEFIVKRIYCHFKELLNIEFWNCDPSKESDFFFFFGLKVCRETIEENSLALISVEKINFENSSRVGVHLLLDKICFVY